METTIASLLQLSPDDFSNLSLIRMMAMLTCNESLSDIIDMIAEDVRERRHPLTIPDVYKITKTDIERAIEVSTRPEISVVELIFSLPYQCFSTYSILKVQAMIIGDGSRTDILGSDWRRRLHISVDGQQPQADQRGKVFCCRNKLE